METEDVLKLREAREELVSWFKLDTSFRGLFQGKILYRVFFLTGTPLKITSMEKS